MDVSINYGAVVVAAIASMVIGMLWYSPILFGSAWTRLLGRSEEEIKKSNPKKAMAGSLVMTLISAYVLAHFVGYMEVSTLTEGLQLGIWLWLGFIATLSYNLVLFEGKPRKLYFINIGYQLVSIVVMSVILAMWQ